MPSITIDGDTKIIDIGYDAPSTVVTAPNIYSEWKRWVQAGNAQYDEAFGLSVGGNDLGGGVSLDAYYFIRNDLGWRIRAADQDHELVIDGQLFGFSPSTAVYLARPGRSITYRTVLSSRSQVTDPAGDAPTAASGYQGTVYLDPNSAFSDSNYPTGTSVQPVNNWSSAVVIAASFGLRRILLLDDSTLANANVSGFEIEGLGRPVLTVDASADVTDASFRYLEIQGVFDGTCHMFNCELVGPVSTVAGHFEQTLIDANGMTINGDTTLFYCSSAVPGNGAGKFDFANGTHMCQARAYSGSIEIFNMVAGAKMSVDMLSGRVIIDASCTGGELKIRGVGEPIVDNSGGAVTIDSDGFLAPASIINPLTGQIWAAS